jgi:predicted nucleic acid-binding protein
MASIEDFLGQRLYIDTNIFIYAVELPKPLSRGQADLFGHIDRGAITPITSELSLAECLIDPLARGDTELAANYEKLLSGDTAVVLVPIDREILIFAAHIRAIDRLKLADAIHIATARVAGATIFLTADRRFKVPPGIGLINWYSLS